jgi:hypothetical protein
MDGSKDAGVLCVMSLGMPSRVQPTDSLAAILAIGNPARRVVEDNKHSTEIGA